MACWSFDPKAVRRPSKAWSCTYSTGKAAGRRRSGDSFDSKPDNLLVLGDHLGSANVELTGASAVSDREEFRPTAKPASAAMRIKDIVYRERARRRERSELSRSEVLCTRPRAVDEPGPEGVWWMG